MKLTFRWQGKQDNVPLRFIRQIPNMSGIVSAVYDVKPGQVWSHESIEQIKKQAADNGLEFEVVESVPVPESIKLGDELRDEHLENFCENVRRCGAHGIKVICYNFMPVFDWTRTQLDKMAPDGSTSLVMYNEQLKHIDPSSDEIALPGWDASYTKEEMAVLLRKYRALGEEGLWKNFEIFLKKVIPVAEEAGVKMAIHPDDPPYPILGLPRILSTAEDFRQLIKRVPNRSNGLCLCTGSLGVRADNDLVSMMYEFGDRIHFVHLRSTQRDTEGNFYEANHLEGNVDMYGMMKALLEVEQRRQVSIPVRPDHGHQMIDDLRKQTNPGYSCIGRLRGLAELRGLELGIAKSLFKD